MLGLSSMVSSEIRCSNSAWNTAWSIMPVTSSQRSMELRSIHQDFRLDDRHEAFLLTERA
jgi:hypothetical protein